MPTKFIRMLAVVIGMPAISHGQVFFDWVDFAEYRQTDTGSTSYLGGRTSAFLTDGSWVIAGCAGQPSPFIITPNITCPLGTTGFIAQGDVDGDGGNDQGSFWSISSLNRASIIEPFRADQVHIISAPPSGIADILRGSNGDTDEVFNVFDFSVVIWYNVLEGVIDDYEMTGLGMTRPYGPGNSELQRHYRDVPWGTYLFTFPGIRSPLLPPLQDGEPLKPVPFAANYIVAPDVYPGRAGLKSGWRLTNDQWYRGALEFDPREFFQFAWEGITNQNTIPADQLFMQMRGHQYVSPDNLTRTAVPPDFFAESKVESIACNIVSTDTNYDEILEPGNTYALLVDSGDLAGTVQYPITMWGTAAGLEPNELLLPDDLSGGLVSGELGEYCRAAFSNPLDEDELRAGLTTNRDLGACLVPGESYELEITSGSADGTIIFPVTRWAEALDPGAVCSPEFLAAPISNTLVFPRFDSAIYRGNGSTDTGYPYVFDVPESDILVFVDGVETDLWTFDDEKIFTDNPIPSTSSIVIARDYSVIYPGNDSTVIGYPITFTANYSDIEVYIDGVETTLFTISADEVFTNVPVAAASAIRIVNGDVGSEFDDISPGDNFVLRPRPIITTSTVVDIAGFYVEGDLDLSGLVPGGDYRIEVTTGSQAGKTFEIQSFGFPNQFWFRTVKDLSNKLDPGDNFEFRLFQPSPTALQRGDTFTLSQAFADWVQAEFDAGNLLAVDELTLACGYLIEYCLSGVPDGLLAQLEVAPGLYGVAREDVIVFPPYPIQTPDFDRSRFLLGTFDTNYEIGPFFFRPGDSVTGELSWVRALTQGVSTDNTLRDLLFTVEFIDSYQGFALAGGVFGGSGFPFGSTKTERSPNYDFDNDGASNLLEFAMQTDVANALDLPIYEFALGEAPGACTATLTKRPFVGSSLNYFFEYSTDLVNWTTITKNDPNFEIVEDTDTTLTVSNTALIDGDFPPPSCFLRIKVTQ